MFWAAANLDQYCGFLVITADWGFYSSRIEYIKTLEIDTYMASIGTVNRDVILYEQLTFQYNHKITIFKDSANATMFDDSANVIMFDESAKVTMFDDSADMYRNANVAMFAKNV